MKQFVLSAVFVMALAISAASAHDRGRPDDGINNRSSVNAETLSMLGLGAASAVGASVYLARRLGRRR